VRDQLAALFPADRKGLRNYFALVADGMAGSRVMEKSGVYMGGSPAKLIAAMLPLIVMHPRFLWLYLVGKRETNRSLHVRFFKDQRLRSMLDRLGYPVMAAMNTIGMWNVYFNDYWAPLGGMQGLANKLVVAARNSRAGIQLDTRVTRILMEGVSAVGVELADGTQERADKVISAVDLRQTCYELIGKEYFPASLIQKLETATPSETVFCVYLGLDERSLAAGAFKRFLHSHVIYFSSSGEMLQLAWLNKDDPSLAPPGKQTLYLACFSPYKQWAHWKGDHNASYQARKETEMQRLIRQAEEVIPDLQAHIEFKEAATPLTFERYTGNWQGASVGWNWDPALNPKIDFVNELKLGNFYQIGHWRFLPGALPSAMITARYIAQDILKTE
jgi:prolycopene isomerase